MTRRIFDLQARIKRDNQQVLRTTGDAGFNKMSEGLAHGI